MLVLRLSAATFSFALIALFKPLQPSTVVVLSTVVVAAGAADDVVAGHPLLAEEEEQLKAKTCSPPSRAYKPLSGHDGFAYMQRYIDLCNRYQVRPNVDVMTQLQLRGGSLTLGVASPFGDMDMRALVMLFEDGNGTELRGLRSFDCQRCSLTLSGVLLVAQMMSHPANCIENLELSNQQIRPEGMKYLAPAVRKSRALTKIGLASCELRNQGGAYVLHLLQSQANGTGVPALRILDLGVNQMDFRLCSDLVYTIKDNDLPVSIILDGNQVLDEVWNAVTHGLGEIWAIGASVFALVEVFRKPSYMQLAILIYLASLNTMFISSTLFHAFFAMGRTTVRVFGILDHSAIFILIAGSYAPFLSISFHGVKWANYLLMGMWVMTALGIATSVFGHGPTQIVVQLTLYLLMGWAAISVIGKIVRKIGRRGSLWLVAGGVSYTLGVPWFVKNGHFFDTFPDHAVWHLFVWAGAAIHFHCIFWYVLPPRPKPPHQVTPRTIGYDQMLDDPATA